MVDHDDCSGAGWGGLLHGRAAAAAAMRSSAAECCSSDGDGTTGSERALLATRGTEFGLPVADPRQRDVRATRP